MDHRPYLQGHGQHSHQHHGCDRVLQHYHHLAVDRAGLGPEGAANHVDGLGGGNECGRNDAGYHAQQDGQKHHCARACRRYFLEYREIIA